MYDLVLERSDNEYKAIRFAVYIYIYIYARISLIDLHSPIGLIQIEKNVSICQYLNCKHNSINRNDSSICFFLDLCEKIKKSI